MAGNNETDFRPTPFEQVPFGTFWLALNRHLTRCGLPEVMYKGAREAWEAAIGVAGEHIRNQQKAELDRAA